MRKPTYTAFRAAIDKLAIRDGVIEPGASYTERFPAGWRDDYDAGLAPELAWEYSMIEDEGEDDGRG